MKSGEINSLFKNLSRVIKNPRSDLKYKNKFTLLVSVVLSAQCTDQEISGDYEKETGRIIVETIKELCLDPLECPGILVMHHGPFTWGKTIEEAVNNAEALEYIAKLAWMTRQLNQSIPAISPSLHSRHFTRKHGPKSYYGQKDK